MTGEKNLKIDGLIQNKKMEILKNGVGSIKNGNNGPYYDLETDVRNIAHWTVIYSEYYLHTKKEEYKDIVASLADYIIATQYCSGKYVYKCRDAEGKDVVNGTIGAAWIIEGLVAAFDAVLDERYIVHAVKVFNALEFDYKYKLWHRTDFNGTKMSIDATFNHQLWFAASGAQIVNRIHDEEINQKVLSFLDGLDSNLKIYKEGLIRHSTRSDKYGTKTAVLFWGRNILDRVCSILNLPSKKYKEQGYHSFNMYAFAKIYDNGYKEHLFFHSPKFEKILNYTFSKKLLDDLNGSDKRKDGTHVKSVLNSTFNLFSFPYNSPAFELPYVNNVFAEENSALCCDYIEKQFEYTFDDKILAFSNNTDDSETLNARVYEYIYKNNRYWSDIEQKNHPMVSLIVPVYNVKDYLEECLNSIKYQKYRNFELILVDDGSKDESGKMCDLFKDKNQDMNIIVIHKINGGLSDARNVGIEKANGEYLAFIDSDDVISSDYLLRLVDAAITYDADIVQCRYSKKLADLDALGRKGKQYNAKEGIKQFLIRGDIHTATWDKLYKRELFVTGIRFPYGKMNEDNFTTYKLVWNSSKIVCIHNILYWYRQRNGSIMYSNFSDRNLDILEVEEELKRFLGDEAKDYISEIEYYKFRTCLYVYNRLITSSKNYDYSEQERSLRSDLIHSKTKYLSKKNRMTQLLIKSFPLVYKKMILRKLRLT